MSTWKVDIGGSQSELYTFTTKLRTVSEVVSRTVVLTDGLSAAGTPRRLPLSTPQSQKP